MFEYNMKNAYLWDAKVPISWLLWYWQLQSNAKDESWNWLDWVWTWTESYETSWWYTWARFTNAWNRSSYPYKSTAYIKTPLIYKDIPISFCMRVNMYSRSPWAWLMSNANWADTQTDFWIREWTSEQTSYNWMVAALWKWENIKIDSFPNTNTWHLYIVTIDSSWTYKVYKDWTTVINSWSWCSAAGNNGYWYIWVRWTDSGWSWSRWINWLMRHCAIYNRVLSVSDVQKYYDWTN